MRYAGSWPSALRPKRSSLPGWGRRCARFTVQLKGALQAETLRAIRAVANGEAILGPTIAVRLQGYLTTPPATDSAHAFPQLTERELEVLELLAERCTNAEIAAKLFLSQKTVRNYVSGILAKLQVADRAEARLIARAAGIGAPARDRAWVGYEAERRT
jgi:DNA-binding NarL/FixJ family response regulator